jgi:hypothetical protein
MARCLSLRSILDVSAFEEFDAPSSIDECLIAQRYDAKILTALLAVGDRI